MVPFQPTIAKHCLHVCMQDKLAGQVIYTSIAMILEAGLEAGFQFFFQAVYYLPTLVLAIVDIYGDSSSLQDLVNWQILSIVFSFLTFSLTSFKIR